MYCFGRWRTTSVICLGFIIIFLSSFIILITSENPSEKEPIRSEVAAKPAILQKLRQAVQLQAQAQRKAADSQPGSSCLPLHFIPHAETRPVTALASFPGSGNTWLRYLIQEATGIHTGSQYVDFVLQRRGFPGEAVTDGSVAVVKTHEWGPKIRERFQKAVLLIRHPQPAIQSLYNLWRGGGHVRVASKVVYERQEGKDWKKFFNGYIKDWQTLNLDWVHNFTGPLHIIFYDQLLNDLGPTLRSLVQFLDLPVDEAALQCTVQHSEGLYHRKGERFDPYTAEMKHRVSQVVEYVFEDIENYLKTNPASSYVSLFQYMKTHGLKAKNK